MHLNLLASSVLLKVSVVDQHGRKRPPVLVHLLLFSPILTVITICGVVGGLERAQLSFIALYTVKNLSLYSAGESAKRAHFL